MSYCELQILQILRCLLHMADYILWVWGQRSRSQQCQMALLNTCLLLNLLNVRPKFIKYLQLFPITGSIWELRPKIRVTVGSNDLTKSLAHCLTPIISYKTILQIKYSPILVMTDFQMANMFWEYVVRGQRSQLTQIPKPAWLHSVKVSQLS